MNSADSKTAREMNIHTLTALQGSIAKWQAIVDGTGVDLMAENCPLCKAFQDEPDGRGEGCNGCPVSAATGQDGCGGSPYDQWSDYFFELRIHPRKVIDEESKRLAQAEVDFLKSLLPPSATSSAPTTEGA